MSQTNTNTGGGNTNHNQHAGRGGRGGRDRGGFGGQGHGSQGDRGNNTIAKSFFDRKMKGGCLNKLVITECSHQATQLKKTNNVLLVICADKEYKYVNNVIQMN